MQTKKDMEPLVEIWINGDSKIYQKHSTVGFQSQNSDDMIIGIGSHTTIDSLVIKWPYPNSTDTFLGSELLINGTNELKEGDPIVASYLTPLCLVDHSVSVSPIPSHNYGASNILDSSSSIIDGSSVLFQAENTISLDIDFEVEVGAEFTAEI